MASGEENGVLPEFERLKATDRPNGVRLSVHVRPRSSRSVILGVREGALDVALTSPPVEGAANAELVALLARALGLRRNDITIAAGASGRSKVIDVFGVNASQARERLGRARR